MQIASLINNIAQSATPTCPKCKAAIRSDDINVVTDIALCRVCNVPYKLSSLLSNAQLETGIDLNRPPAGTWYESSPLGTVIGATHRSVGATFGLLLITLFWNGIVSVFVLLATSAKFLDFGVHDIDWFPALKLNGGHICVGMTIFLFLFLTSILDHWAWSIVS